ncbi:hypothetical protein HYV44_02270 [Candidatus Microgenomates bacterium]|nr:hypothetical protein [Candidatus Microgenomates bacterium]
MMVGKNFVSYETLSILLFALFAYTLCYIAYDYYRIGRGGGRRIYRWMYFLFWPLIKFSLLFFFQGKINCHRSIHPPQKSISSRLHILPSAEEFGD